MMKKIVCMSAILTVGMAVGQVMEATEKIPPIVIGESRAIDLPFALQNFKATPTDAIQVENVTDRQLRLTGLKPGVCDLVVNGGGLSKQYTVTVQDNIDRLLKRLRKDLDGLPLDCAINQDYIVIQGEISNVEDWALLRQVLPLYEKNVRNNAKFRPKPETLVNLKKTLTDLGFDVTDETTPKEAGKIGFVLSRDAVTLTGRLYAQYDIETIKQVLATQEWLAFAGDENKDGKLKLILNLSVEPTMIDVGAVYVGVTSDEAKTIGTQDPASVFGITGNFSKLINLIRGGGNDKNATISADLNSTIRFLAGNGVSRFKTAAHLTFISNESKVASFHQGGTMSVRVQGVNSGDLKEIDYGLMFTVSGGLIGANKVKLDVTLSRVDPPSPNSQGDYDRGRNNVTTSIICDLNETVVLAGMKEITELTNKTGLPYLRNVPVLSWFVSSKGTQQSDMQLLILISPRIASQGATIDLPPSAETADTLQKADTPNKERMKAEAQKKPWWKRIF